ncbi:hypothetical protein RRF57_012749 [Xylaria bambusicola]|uniref:Uncharacterized protein n=1 Tax=Xylaria bambusicola TaxID=326684 RepID=A0AAN7ZB53_9PEZI
MRTGVLSFRVTPGWAPVRAAPGRRMPTRRSAFRSVDFPAFGIPTTRARNPSSESCAAARSLTRARSRWILRGFRSSVNTTSVLPPITPLPAEGEF